MANRHDYYDILGVSHDADANTIKKAFRSLARKYHPDRNKAADAEAKFKEIAEAYAILRDAKKRADYDARGHAGVEGLTPEDLYGGIDLDEMFGGLRGFDLGTGGVFEHVFRRRAGPRPGAALHTELVVSLNELLKGDEHTVRSRRPLQCRTCHGSGASPGTAPRQCSGCGGSGRRVTSRQERGINLRQITVCSECAGRGTIIDNPCSHYGGSG